MIIISKNDEIDKKYNDLNLYHLLMSISKVSVVESRSELFSVFPSSREVNY